MSNEMRHELASENVGEIVEVEGGHIVRSTGRKDRHSKVCTAKGPRDRRVRLSAPTAIQFYDVQDRLGFDRPSKAVDWLINKAKSAIDDLDELPPWNPVDTLRQHAEMVNSRPRRRASKTETETEQNHHHQNETSFLLPASLDSDSIADTIKSFFPVAPPQSYHHHHQPPPPSSDLRLSLQSFQNGESFGSQTEHALFSEQSSPLGFDSSWEQNQHQSPEFGRIQRVMTWNNGGVTEGGGGGFVSASPAVAATTSYQPVYGQSQFLSTQRGPLQSINTPMIRGWFDPNHHHHNHQSITSDDLHHHQHQPYHVPSAIPGIAFASNGEFSGFRIHQDDNKPSSASSDSRH